MNKAIRILVAISLAAGLGLSGAVAEQASWTVADVLSLGDAQNAASLMQPVDASATDGQVTLHVQSAVTDGDTLAFDWAVVNTTPDAPVLMRVDSLTINGVKVDPDNTDEFDNQWLPGCFSADGAMYGGEILALPESLRAENMLRVVMTAGVYRSILPVYNLAPYNEDLAKAKIAEGYLVVPEGEGYVEDDPEEGMAIVVSAPRKTLEKKFTRTEATLTFDIDATAGRAATRQLQAEESYAAEGFTLRYTKATLSPLGLYLNVLIQPTAPTNEPPGYDQFHLTDGQGTPLDTVWPSGECYSETAADGSVVYVLTAQYYGLTEAALPDSISLSYFKEGDTATAVFPVTVRP